MIRIPDIGVARTLLKLWGDGQRAPLTLDAEGKVFTQSRDTPKRGRYRIGQGTGAYAGIAANGELFQARWGDAKRKALIWQVSVSVAANVAATAASQIDRQLIIARQWTANGTGGTSISLAGNLQALAADMPASLFTDVRIASNAALGAGTKTLDGAGLGIASGTMGTNAVTALGQIISKVDLFNAQMGPNCMPIVLSQNMGIVIRMVTAQPAGSSFITYVDVEWSEVDSF